MPRFRAELERLFPDKETVFHHLGNYLFNPSNQAWGLITRFYDAYLARADERIGLQVRVFNTKASPIPLVAKQLLKCTQSEGILPQLQVSTNSSFSSVKALADIYLLSLCDVLVTSRWSTFGYVAQAIGRVKPWILNVPNTNYSGDRLPERACRRAVSMEPCFHYPPSYDMKKKVVVDGEVGTGPPVVHCEDVSWGLKLVNGRQIERLG
ncbi:unnamed protein product [Linum tenue]|uniref:Fucosyltransferase n=1 Tax=Linum tenue TaxID=586396 RepID=A0AAV0KGA6_9ROSI|nr:unnamed protein product [Linum tenue]